MSSISPNGTARPAGKKFPTGQPHRRRISRLSMGDRVFVLVCLAVPILADVAFVWGPAIGSVLLSFTSWNGIGGLSTIRWTGTTNYVDAATVDPQFWPAIAHNFIWLLVFLVIATPLGMLFAVLIDRGLWGSRIYQSIIFLPVMLSLALIGIIWELIYAPNFGLLNSLLGRTSNSNLIDWLGNSRYNLWAILVEATWRQSGYVMVLYLAGLKGVDPTLKEAAEIDGANSWRTFWHVVFPVMKPINIVILVITVIESLRAYDLVYITTKGTIIPGLELLSMLVTQNIVGQTTRIGYGSAIATVLLVVSLVPITIFLFQTFRERASS